MKIFALSLALLLSVISHNLHAATVVFAEISRDDSDLVYKLVIDTTDFETMDQVRKETYQKGIKTANEVLNPADLPKGIVLEEQKNFKVVILRSFNFSMTYGGTVTVDTLYSGLTGERREFDFDLEKTNSSWSLFKDNKQVKFFEIKVHRVPIFGVIGIKELFWR